jgi:hypothetical protein
VRRAILLLCAFGFLLASCGGEEFPGGTYRSTGNVNNVDPVTSTFHDDGTLTIVQGELVIHGRYTAEGTQITLSDEYCLESEGQETATYAWHVDGSILRMYTVDDLCDFRVDTFQEMTPVE